MSLPQNLVTIHPYFKVHPGKQEQAESLMREFVAKTRSEPLCLFYEFTVNGDEVFCREGYVGSAGVLAHLENIGAILAQMLTVSELIRLEFHGPAAELVDVRGPLAHLNPGWFVLKAGIER